MDWDQREGRILEAISEFEEEGRRPGFREIVERTGLKSLVAEFGVQSLLDAGYITGIDARTMDGFDYLELRLLPEGRRALGQWHRTVAGPVEDLTAQQQAGTIEVFVSHSSSDADVAEALVQLLRISLGLEAEDIRCTSVDGYRLRGGINTIERLRIEVLIAKSMLGLISYESAKSAFVMFELGARWGSNRHMVPLLCPGVKPGVLGGPLASLNALRLDSASQLHQLMAELGEVLNRRPAAPASYQSAIERIVKLPARREKSL